MGQKLLIMRPSYGDCLTGTVKLWGWANLHPPTMERAQFVVGVPEPHRPKWNRKRFSLWVFSWIEMRVASGPAGHPYLHLDTFSMEKRIPEGLSRHHAAEWVGEPAACRAASQCCYFACSHTRPSS